MVKVPKGYRSSNVEDRRTGTSSRRRTSGGSADLLGSVLGGNSMGGGLLGSLVKSGALTAVLGSVLGGGSSRGGGLGGLLGGMLGGGGAPTRSSASRQRGAEDDDAAILLRAMINAAKADGQIDKQEIEAIVGRLGEIDANEKAFLEHELAQPLDVADFCNDVPKELAQQAYAFSLLGMKLDTQQEAQYLGAVAQGLSLDPNTCNAIHDKLGVPHIFK